MVSHGNPTVLFMAVPGLALFYGGMVRAGSVVSVMLQCFAIACLVTILWLVAIDPQYPVFATFQLTFAIITSALLVGTFVERLRFLAVLKEDEPFLDLDTSGMHLLRRTSSDRRDAERASRS